MKLFFAFLLLFAGSANAELIGGTNISEDGVYRCTSPDLGYDSVVTVPSLASQLPVTMAVQEISKNLSFKRADVKISVLERLASGELTFALDISHTAISAICTKD